MGGGSRGGFLLGMPAVNDTSSGYSSMDGKVARGDKTPAGAEDCLAGAAGSGPRRRFRATRRDRSEKACAVPANLRHVTKDGQGGMG